MYSAIKLRKSVKHFKNEVLDSAFKNQLFAYIDDIAIPFTNEKIDVHFIENGHDIQKKFKGITKMYGRLDSPHFLAFSSKDNSLAREAVGYLGEMISLYMINHQVGSCWVALSKANDLPVVLEEDHRVYALLAIGIPEDPIRPIKSRNRMPLDSFVSGDINGKFIPIIESVIDAPSSRNSQPWTFKFTNDSFTYSTTEPFQSLFSKQKQIYNDLNRGIGLAHLLVSLDHHHIAYELSVDHKVYKFNYQTS